MRGNDFAPQYKRLQIMLARTRIKNELRRKEYYESPSEKRVRLASERHRRRFAHMVSPGGGRGDWKVIELTWFLGEGEGASGAVVEKSGMMHACHRRQLSDRALLNV